MDRSKEMCGHFLLYSKYTAKKMICPISATYTGLHINLSSHLFEEK